MVTVDVFQKEEELGMAAAEKIAALLREVIVKEGSANLLLSTGASQFCTLSELVKKNVAWDKVTLFHLDEYVGLPESHPASFRNYLKKRFSELVPLKQSFFIAGEGDPEKTASWFNEIMVQYPIDVGVIGIGENAHIAFNDPPANFDVESAYHVVTLSDTCKMQQVAEGWFESMQDVPKQAISMTSKQIMKCKYIVSPVPGKRKSAAIRAMLTATKTDPMVPATLLKSHPAFFLYLDQDSASECAGLF